ncbi:MAG: hypothetical protein LBS45_08470 [Synergistaceae bacterium]|jgi:hypothetical protein|nr:hypothetical protein [Synergistaceae bacterium]
MKKIFKTKFSKAFVVLSAGTVLLWGVSGVRQAWAASDTAPREKNGAVWCKIRVEEKSQDKRITSAITPERR